MSTSPNNAAPPLAPTLPKETKREAWLIWRLPILLFWWALAAAIVNNMTGEELVRSYSLFFLLPLVTLLLMLVRRQKLGWLAMLVLSVWFVLYWVSFPIVAPVQVIIWLPKGLEPVKKVCNYLVLPLHLIFSPAYIPMLLLSWYILWFSRRCDVITYTVYAEIALNTALLLVAMRWAADPMYPFIQFASSCIALQAWWDSLKESHPANATNVEQMKQQMQTRATFLGYYEKMFKSFDDFVDWLESRTIVAVFVGVLVSLFLITVLGYGACMYAIQRLECQPSHYSELGDDLYRCCIFSLSVLTTAPLANVIPNTMLAKFLYGMELVGTFLIATVFFGMFSAAKGFHGKERFKEYKKKTRCVFKWIAAVKQKHDAILNPPPPAQLEYRPDPPPASPKPL